MGRVLVMVLLLASCGGDSVDCSRPATDAGTDSYEVDEECIRRELAE